MQAPLPHDTPRLQLQIPTTICNGAYYDGGDDDDAVLFRSHVVSRRELARRRLGLRDAPEAAERQKQW